MCAKHALFAHKLREGPSALLVEQPREVGGVVREALGQSLERDAFGVCGNIGEEQGDKVVGASTSGMSANRGACQRDGRRGQATYCQLPLLPTLGVGNHHEREDVLQHSGVNLARLRYLRGALLLLAKVVNQYLEEIGRGGRQGHEHPVQPLLAEKGVDHDVIRPWAAVQQQVSRMLCVVSGPQDVAGH